MKFYKSRTFKIFVGVLVVLIIGVAAAAAMHSGSSPANSVISTVFSPLQRASSFLAQKFSAFSINFKSSATLSKQVDELNKEIEDLQSQLVDYEQMKSQNALYKEFLELKESHKDYKFCEASVVGRDAANPLSAFVLNRGSNDGIAVNDPVIYGKYLVGVVTSVTLTQCTIKTILNPSVNTSAYEIRTRDLGFVTTTAAYAKNGLCTMPGLSSSTAVSPGGIVCTSGVGGIYPRDLIIGTVTKSRGLRHGHLRDRDNQARRGHSFDNRCFYNHRVRGSGFERHRVTNLSKGTCLWVSQPKRKDL